MNDRIKMHFEEARQVLEKVLADEAFLASVERAGEVMRDSLNQGGKIISCGNGGSMCDAMHFAEELTGRFRDDRAPLPAIAISDPSHLSCVANDYGFEHVFARFIEGVGKAGDVLLAISTSGNSANVVRAAETAKKFGITVVGLTGHSGGKLAALCDVEIRVPHMAWADRIQEIHIKVIHALIDHLEQKS